jgi:hypothetical protein
MEASADHPGGAWWTGTELAERALPAAVRRPRLLGVTDWSEGQYRYRAELTSYVAAPSCSDSPDLRHAPDLPGCWFADLRSSLDALASTPAPPDRQAIVNVSHMRKAVRHFLAVDVFDATVFSWVLAHGDLHWANVTGPELTILDWEGFGLAPRGYDPAFLYAYALPHPATAAAIRRQFADVLDTREGRLAELFVAAGIVMSGSAGHKKSAPAHSRLLPLVRAHADRLLGR